ncbi:MAG: MATE family efflux transporter [Oscillospiraceae bacterium]|nr:MATE family efflux transporter [Oscillospiraceae bacterium]MDD4413971.1 MATE family efflux transporter [Oscillospiraceae bacterium]
MSTFQRDMTQGSVTKHLIRFSLPFLAANLLQAFYNLADMLIVGIYGGAVGTSAVGTGGLITILVINLISGLAVGGTVMIAQFIGARRQDDVKKTIGTMFTLYAIAAVVLTVVMLIFNKYILVALNTPKESFDEALAYLNICMGGTIFMFGYNAVSAVLRGLGDSRHPLIFVAVATVMNIVLDIIFVGPLNLGAAGAAWATVIAQATSFILSVMFLRSKDFIFDFRLKSFKINGRLAVQLLKIGLPSSLQGVMVSFSFLFLTRLANDIAGIVGSTALSITSKVNSFAILPSIALQVSVSSMAGQNFGAGKPERAKKTMLSAMGLGTVISLIIFAAVNIFSVDIMSLFLGSGNTELSAELVQRCITEGSLYLRSVSFNYIIVCFVFCINGLAMGAGQTLFSMFNAMVSSLLLRIPAAWLLGITLGRGLPGVGFAAPIATMGSLIVGVIYILSGRWRTSGIERQV